MKREWTEVREDRNKDDRGDCLAGREEKDAEAVSPGAGGGWGITNPLKESQSVPFT